MLPGRRELINVVLVDHCRAMKSAREKSDMPSSWNLGVTPEFISVIT